jgi:hypothetical protein
MSEYIVPGRIGKKKITYSGGIRFDVGLSILITPKIIKAIKRITESTKQIKTGYKFFSILNTFEIKGFF